MSAVFLHYTPWVSSDQTKAKFQKLYSNNLAWQSNKGNSLSQTKPLLRLVAAPEYLYRIDSITGWVYDVSVQDWHLQIELQVQAIPPYAVEGSCRCQVFTSWHTGLNILQQASSTDFGNGTTNNRIGQPTATTALSGVQSPCPFDNTQNQWVRSKKASQERTRKHNSH